MAHFEVGVVAAKPALGDQDCHVCRRLAEPARAGLNQHVREARLERQSGDCAAVLRKLPGVVDRAEARQPRAGFGERGGGGRVEEGEARWVGLAPLEGGQEQARQIGLEDFGRVVRGEGAVRRFLPQADRDPGALARGTAGALGDGGAAGALGHQPGEPRAAIVARAPREPAVDDDGNVVERQAGLGDRAGEDQLARARWRRGKRGALRGGIDLAVKAVEDDFGREGAERVGGALDLGHPGEEGEQRAGVIAQRAAD